MDSPFNAPFGDKPPSRDSDGSKGFVALASSTGGCVIAVFFVGTVIAGAPWPTAVVCLGLCAMGVVIACLLAHRRS
jgi:hypothetical protein